MSNNRHHFIESDTAYKYERVIFCTACGMVVFHFNHSNNLDYQKKVGTPCIEATLRPPITTPRRPHE